MSTAIAERESAAPIVTTEQLDLVRRTVAHGATPDELRLYLYDCARQGVHPLDKLLHFTKRGGKYTPVTSIDLMRTRAADTGEYAGSDDAEFDGYEGKSHPDTAKVTVWRLVQGQRCAFTATARWAEYCPSAGSDLMWKKMPHTMLSKCAEALALRKGFPRQLAGLYAREELDQASEDRTPYTISAPTAEIVTNELPGQGTPLRIVEVKAAAPGLKAKAFVRHSHQHPTDDALPVYDERLATLAEHLCQEGVTVKLESVVSKTTKKPYLTKLEREPEREPETPPAMLEADDIPF